MSLKSCLILLTVISVVCDTMVLPFYPQFFSKAFGVESPEHVGFYLAACCMTVMLAFPVWARVAKRVHELHLWVYTQIGAAIFGLLCYLATDIVEFWIVSQLMLVLKASYLLIYPFVLRLESQDKHLGIVGLFAVLMHFGGIGGALVGGMVLEVLSPRDMYLIMAGGDIVQVLLCLYLIKRQNVPFYHEAPTEQQNTPTGSKRYVWHIGLVALLLYGCSFMSRPFFSLFWHQISGIDNEILAAWIYAIPAWAALASLWYQHKKGQSDNHLQVMLAAFVIAAVGLVLQGSSEVFVVVMGRVLFGLALFQATVRLDVLLFSLSRPEDYSRDFAKVHIFQNIGVIGASFAVGPLVDAEGLAAPFALAAAGFALTAMVFYLVFVSRAQQVRSVTE